MIIDIKLFDATNMPCRVKSWVVLHSKVFLPTSNAARYHISILNLILNICIQWIIQGLKSAFVLSYYFQSFHLCLLSTWQPNGMYNTIITTTALFYSCFSKQSALMLTIPPAHCPLKWSADWWQIHTSNIRQTGSVFTRRYFFSWHRNLFMASSHFAYTENVPPSECNSNLELGRHS